MATGDILAVAVEANGSYLDITIEGLSTGGTYVDGMGANNVPETGDPKITLTVTSLGYDDAGAQTTITRTVWGTKWVRKVTPNEAQADETISGSDVIVRVWLSDLVFQKDQAGGGNSGTNISYNIKSGFYTQGGTPNNASTGTCTNNSTLAYSVQKVVAKWSWPGYERFTGTDITVRALAFHAHAQLGRPVRCIRFSATDGTNTAYSSYITAMTIDGAIGDALPSAEYIGTISMSTLTQGATLTLNFIAYPWVGDSGALTDTSTGTADPTPLLGPKTGVCDKNNTYGVTCALVDPTGSDAGANTVYDESTFNSATAYKFLTIGKAASAIAAYNNTNRARNDVGAGVVYLNAGNYAWLGSSNTYGTTPNTWITIKPTVGVARNAVTISSTSGNGDISDRIKLEGVTITTATANTFTNVAAMWVKDCDINSSGTGLWNTTGGVVWETGGLCRQLAQGFRSVATGNLAFALVRGVDLTGFNRTIHCYTVMGNVKRTKYAPSSALFVTEINGQTAPASTGYIIYNNLIYGYQCNTSLAIDVGTYGGANTVGGAIVQNLIENTDVAVGGLASINASDAITTNTPLQNLILHHNTWLGQRCFIGYNDAGTIFKARQYWSSKNNYWDRWANKGDTFSPTNVNRVGAWPITNNIGSSGNYMAQTMISLPDNFFAEYNGINSFEPALSSVSDVAKFVNLAATTGATGNVAGAGDGDYHLQDISPLIGLTRDFVLPFDAEGTARYSGDAVGVYSYPVAGGGGGAYKLFRKFGKVQFRF